MPPIGKDAPEMSYRRGFEHGATEMFRAVAGLLDEPTRAALRGWIEDVHAWRYKATLDYPPIWRLKRVTRTKRA